MKTLTSILLMSILLFSCKKEDIEPNKPVTHKYEYIVYGTSGSINVQVLPWNYPAGNDTIVEYNNIAGDSFSVRWTHEGNSQRLLFVQAVSNNPFGWVTVEIKKDGNTVLKETKSGMDTCRVQIVN